MVDQSTISRDVKVLKELSQQFVCDLAKSDLAYYYKQSIDGIDSSEIASLQELANTMGLEYGQKWLNGKNTKVANGGMARFVVSWIQKSRITKIQDQKQLLCKQSKADFIQNNDHIESSYRTTKI